MQIFNKQYVSVMQFDREKLTLKINPSKTTMTILTCNSNIIQPI